MADQRMTVTARYEADVAGYVSSMKAAADVTDKLATSAGRASDATTKTGAAASKAAGEAARAQEAMLKAQDRAADAAGRLRVAQERLAAARKGGDTQKIAAAEEAVAAAQRDVESTAREAATATDAYEAAAGKAATAADQLASGMEDANSKSKSFGDVIKDNSETLNTVGTAMTTAGAGLTAIGVGAGKAAMDWESAWTGVMKTNDGTAEQTKKLEGELRNLTSVLPASHSEIASVAEAAGQLGVGIDDVAGFTETMINMGESTNLSADEAATSIAKFSNIMGTSFSDAGRLGSVIVDLGNNFATTEQDIVDMSMRLAGVGKQLNLSEGDVMGLATAMSSVGIEAEAGGTAMTTVMKKIDGAVRTGGDSLQGWADLAGTSAEEFGEAWKRSPVEALDLVINGMARTQEAGGDVNQALTDLGIKGIRESDTLIRLAGTADGTGESMSLLAQAVEGGNAAWEDGSALAEEASKRYETAESKIRIAWNQIVDAAIDAGAAILPAVAGVAEGVADLAQGFTELPGPVKGAVGVIAGVGGAALTAAGGFLLLAPRIVDTARAVKDLPGIFGQLKTSLANSTGPAKNLSGALGGMSGAVKGLLGVGGVAALAVAIGAAFTDKHVNDAQQLETAILQIGNAADDVSAKNMDAVFQNWDTMFGQTTVKIDDLDGAMSRLANAEFGDGINKWADQTFAWTGLAQSDVTQVETKVRDLVQTMADMANNGNTEAATAAFSELADAYERNGGTAEDLQQKFPQLTEALQGQAAQLGVNISEAEALEWALSGVAPEAVAAAEGADQMAGSLDEAGDAAAEATGDIEAVGDAAQGVAETDMSGMSAMEQAWVTQREAAKELVGTMQEAEETLDDLLEGFKAAAGQTLELPRAMGNFREAIEGVSAALEENGRNMDATTEAGLKNHEAVAAVVEATYDMAGSMAAAGESQQALSGHLQNGWEQAVTSAEKLGMTREAAEKLANEMFNIPPDVSITTEMDTQALQIAEMTGTALDDLPGTKTVDVVVDDMGNTIGTIVQRIDGVTGQKSVEFVASDTGESVAAIAKTVEDVSGVPRTVYVRADDEGTILHTQQSLDGLTGKQVEVYAEALTDQAEGRLENVARGRTASVDALAFVDQAEGWLNHTARDRTQNTFVTPFTDIAEGAFNQTARDRVQDTTTAAHTGTAEGMFDTAARDRIQDSTAIAHTGEAEGDLNYVVRPRTAPVTAVASTFDAKIALDALKSPIRTPINAYVNSVSNPSNLGVGTVLRRAEGGRIPGLAAGGRLPYTGLGTDQILGVSSTGMPVARVDDGEWVIRESSARKYDRLLAAINRDDPKVRHLAGYAEGGRARGREWSGRAVAPQVTVQAPPAQASPGYTPEDLMSAAGRVLNGAQVVLDGRQTVGALRLANTR